MMYTRYVWLWLALTLCFLTSEACAKDINNALQNYTQIRAAQRTDERCHILSSAERAALDSYVAGLQSFIERFDAHSAQTLQRLEQAPEAADDGGACEDKAAFVQEAFAFVVGKSLATKGHILTWAMDAGKRCHAISDEDYAFLTQAYTAYGKQIVQTYGRKIFIRYIGNIRAGEARSDQIPCGDVPQLIEEAKKNAVQPE